MSSSSSSSSSQFTAAPIAQERLMQLAMKSRENKDSFDTLTNAYEQMIRNQLRLITIGNEALTKQQAITRGNETQIQQLNVVIQAEREQLSKCSADFDSQNAILIEQRGFAEQYRANRAKCESDLRATIERLGNEEKQLQEQFTLTTANLAECLRTREEKSRA